MRHLRSGVLLDRALIVLLAGFVSLVSLAPVSAGVRWRNGEAETPSQLDRAQRSSRIGELAARESARRVVVQFEGALTADDRAELRRAGIRLLSYLGDHAYFAALTPKIDAARAGTLDRLRDVRAIETSRKLHPDLAAGVVHDWSIVERPKPGDAGENRPETVALYVLFHPDVALESEVPQLVARHGGTLRSYLRSVHGAVIHLRSDRVEALADEDAVMYVEPPLPQFVEWNDSNRDRVGAGTAQEPPYGLDGSGVTVLVYDGGRMFEHGDFGTRLTIGTSDTAAISDHATHVGGTIGGDGSGSSGQFRGMAPGVDIVSYGFEQAGGLTEGFLYTDPGDMEADYTEAITVFGADVSNNSIGTNTAPNGFPCEWEGNYGVTGALIDALVRGSTGSPFRVVWANGNERSSGACGTAYNTTAPPACAKNHITVGALNSENDSVTSFTSWGPADDGRLKPDVSAPGCQGNDDGGVTSTSSSGGYNTKCGTSMASPTTAGVVALMLQQYRQTLPGAPDPTNATVKAILANTAVDIGNPGPDYQTGYGSIRAIDAIDAIAAEQFLEAEVGQGDVYSFIVLVGPEDTGLQVTLAWDDAPGTPNVDPVLVNDLDLRVFDSSGTEFFPWTLDGANPADPAVRTQRDGLNNIEQVTLDAPPPGAYRVEIEGVSIAEGPTQSFGVAASPTLINCAPAGTLSTNTRRISCSGDLEVQVIDCDLNTDDALVDSVSVSVTSTTEPTGESLTLLETAAESAAFSGTLAVGPVDAAGTLQVAEGDTIVVTYLDADDGDGGTNLNVTREVTVDCTPPSVVSVVPLVVAARSAGFEITLDEPARLTLNYGPVCGAAESSTVSFGLSDVHTIDLSGLIDSTTYFFDLTFEDEAGNAGADDASGACYSFTTTEVPEYFTEQFTGGIDLEGSLMTFTPGNPVDFYDACIEPLGGVLPTDPAGGTSLGLGDDQPGSFVLGDGATVSLYGETYDTVFVGPNGYVTFGAGDSAYTESFSAHFDTPRVAAVFDDLNPSSAGDVTWKQLGDRVAVTWEGVPEYSSSNSNTFQIEVFFDGTVRIAWLDLDGLDAVVGLSAGLGVDPDFLASDLSAAGACGPRPPFVQGMSVQTDVGQPLDIDVVAADDGLPEPAALLLRVTSLPASGALIDDATGLPILTVPHDLDVGANRVRYQPTAGYQGADSFEFRADDGGVPPEGGESGPATVSITVGGPQVLFEALVDDTDPGWAMTGDWAFGAPSGAGSHSGDPTGGATGSNVYGYDLTGDYPNNMGVETLTSTAFDLTGVVDVQVEFQRWLGVESASYDHAAFEVSIDGSNWITIWDHSGSALDEGAWSTLAYDISTIADDQPTVYLRWSQGSTDGSVTFPGWNLDDIRILGVTSAPACTDPPDEVSDVRFGADRETLTWVAPSSGGTDAVQFDVLRSKTYEDFVSAASCVGSDGSVPFVTDPAFPNPGAAFFYLVRAETSCGSGSLGYRTSGVERVGVECSLP